MEAMALATAGLAPGREARARKVCWVGGWRAYV